ncbi:MAG TPA: hypothetical protein VFS60_04965 [Thermoanaerobaculia bacterium]|nr:hypothetical protein [Thermoanaerobaculia bacterium]
MRHPRVWHAGCRLLFAVVFTATLGGCRPQPDQDADVRPTPTPAPAVKIPDCAPSFCAASAAEFWAFDPQKVPVPRSHLPSAQRNRSLAAGFETTRLFAATDEAGNYDDRELKLNDYQAGFQGGGNGGNVYNFSQWPYVGLFYYYVHAPVSVPPTGWINTAHRHGTPIVGVVTGDCAGCGAVVNEILEEPAEAAKQLESIAQAYGLDGWAVDVELDFKLDLAIKLMAALRDKKSATGDPLLVVFYEAFKCDLRGGDQQEAFKAAGSFYADYCEGQPDKTYEFVIGNKAPDNNPLTTAYARDMYREYELPPPCTNGPERLFNGGKCENTQSLFDSMRKIRKPGGGYYQAPGLFALGWERWAGDGLNPGSTRELVQQAQRDLFVGFGAVHSGDSCKPSPPAENSVAAFVDAAGVELTAPFVTRFNTGEGDSFSIQGSTPATTAWNGIGLQDVQPTWLCAQQASQKVAITYAASYDGGSSLAISGPGIVSLYSTKMALPRSPRAIVRYQGPQAPLAVVKDGSGSWQTAKQVGSGSAGNWSTSIQDFPTLSGTITEIGVRAFTAATRVGELGVMDAGDYRPDSPPPVQSLPAPTAGELTWTNPAGTWYSNVYGCSGAQDAEPQLLGRTFQPAFDPKYTILRSATSFPKYIVQPVTTAGIATTSFGCN